MRQLFLNKSNLVVKEVAQPLLHDYSVLVSVQYAYISSETDISNLDTRESFLNNVPHKVKRVLEAVALQATSSKKGSVKPHAALGYSCSGRVVSVGKKVTKFAPGDYVACLDPGYSPHSDLICVPESCVAKISQEKNIKHASITTFAACGLQALRRASVQIGETVCIFGMDSIGLLMVQLARIAGCTVIAVDSNPARLEYAKNMGAYATYELTEHTLREIDLITERHGVDASFVVTQEKTFFQSAAQITREHGKIVLLQGSDPSANTCAWQKDIDILLSHDISGASGNRGVRWTDNRNIRTCLELIESGALQVAPFIADEASLKTIADEIKKITPSHIGGIVLSYEEKRPVETSIFVSPFVTDSEKQVADKAFVPAKKDTFQIGILGAGEFTQNVLLPYFSQHKHASIHALADVDVSKAKYLAGEFEIEKTFAKPDDFFHDQSLDVIVIASSHVFHADHAIKALHEGKAIMLEKPMATDFSQLQRLISFLDKNRTVPFAVNYGLAQSQFARKVKKQVAQRKTPLIAHYRINRDCNPIGGRSDAGMGAGRIIGDTCQIIDFFCELTDAQPVSISVEAMHAARDDIFPTDNVSTQISFSDGSVCSLLYTTLGHAGIGSDRCEIYYDGKAILMQDQKELYGFGLSSRFNETITKPDFGYEACISDFFETLRKNSSGFEVPVKRLHMVSQITLLIDKLACEGGGKQEM